MEKKSTSRTQAIEIIANRLYWVSDTKPPQSQSTAFYFCIDNDLVYQPFAFDFGPLNLGQTHLFCFELHKLLTAPDYTTAKIYHYCRDKFDKMANAAYLMGVYQVVMLKRTAEQAMAPFEGIVFTPFRDAIRGPCAYECKILHCLQAFENALKLNWYDPLTFNVKDYEHYEKVENGDINWIIPGKMLAFSTPIDSHSTTLNLSASFYVPIFKKLGVTMVIRLTTKEYDREVFVKNGFKHLDLYFEDGQPPPEVVLKKFLEECEKQKGAIAVHCKAGLGRTGTLIACYVIKNYKIPAAAIIAWTRICRPGSILGPQQSYLIGKEEELLKAPSIFGIEVDLADRLKNMKISPETTERDKHVLQNGDAGQGERLMERKKALEKKKK